MVQPLSELCRLEGTPKDPVPVPWAGVMLGGSWGSPARRGCSNPPWPGHSVFGVTSHVQVALGVPWPHSSLGSAPCALKLSVVLEGTEADGTAVIREMPA